MSSIAKAPWHVVFSACSAIVAGTSYDSSTSVQIAYSGNYAAIDTRISEYQAVAGLESASSVEVHEWMALAASVFAVVASVLIPLGILLWQGALRPGVRLTLTITALSAFIGFFIPLLSAGTASAIQEDTVLFMVVVQGAALVGALLSWSRPVKGWIAELVDSVSMWGISVALLRSVIAGHAGSRGQCRHSVRGGSVAGCSYSHRFG
jgi:hypothetical protein